MGFWDFMTASTPGGIAGDVAKNVIGGVMDGADRIIRDFKLTPDQVQAWDKFVQEQKERAAELLASDRNSARQREMTVKDTVPRNLAYVIIGAALALTAFQIVAFFLWPEVTDKIPAPAWSMIGGLTGYLFSEAKLVTAYYFGGSMSGDESHATLSELSRGK